MRIAIIMFALSLTVAFVACGGSSAKPKSGEGAADAAKRQLRFLGAGDFGKHWDELHPGQQANVPRAQYINCAQGLARSTGSIDIIETHDEAIAIDGVPEQMATAIRLKTGGGTATTAREVRVDDRWRWTLSSGAYAAFKGGGCPHA